MSIASGEDVVEVEEIDIPEIESAKASVANLKKVDVETAYQAAIRAYTRATQAESIDVRDKAILDMVKAASRAKGIKVASGSGSTHYPGVEDPEFVARLLGRSEFARLKQPARERGRDVNKDRMSQACQNNSFSLTKPQQFARSFISPYTPYNGILLFHGVGIGKTCAAVQVAEAFKDVFAKPVLVITPKSLMEGFKLQVFDPSRGSSQCTGETYVGTLIGKEGGDVTSGYEVISYGKFANQLQATQEAFVDQLGFERKIRSDFSDRVIIVDEAHNLRMVQNHNKGIARAMATVLKIATNVKLVLLTATPLFNDTDEMRFLMEMLYLNDKQFDKAKVVRRAQLAIFPLKPDVKELLSEFSQRYVSYVRGENPTTFPKRLWPREAAPYSSLPKLNMRGEAIPSDKRIKYVPLYATRMSDLQQKVYDLRDAQLTEDDFKDKENGEQFGAQDLSQICDMVFPTADGVESAFGQSGFSACFSEIRRRGEAVKYSYRDDVLSKHGPFLDKDLRKYSSKLAKIVELAKSAKGIVIVYSRYIWASLMPLALAMEHAGFVNYNGNMLADQHRKVEKAGPRYALMVAQQEAVGASAEFKARARMVQIINKPENMDGSNVKVVLLSGVATEGIDYKNIREVHVLDPWHNLSKIEQIIGRGVRNCSHKLLPPAQRNCTIYLHCATRRGGGDERETLDLHMYRSAEAKQIHISAIERILKEGAVDCHLNKEAFDYSGEPSIEMIDAQGNKVKVAAGDRDGSKACDFDKCVYKCAAKKPDFAGAHDATDDEFFTLRAAQNYVEAFRGHFSEKESASLKDLEKAARESAGAEFEEAVFMRAISRMVTMREPVTYRGVPGYVIYRADAYLFQPASTQDTKITVAERRRAPLDAMKSRISKVSVKHVQEDALKSGDLDRILETLAERSKAFVAMGASQQSAMDASVDRLTSPELRAVAEAVLSNGIKKGVPDAIRRSLKSGGVLVDSDTFYDYFGDVYRTKDGDELPSYSAKKLKIQHVAEVKKSISGFQRLGFVAVFKGKPVFKIVHVKEKAAQNLSGVVCEAYSQLQKSKLAELVSAVGSAAWGKKAAAGSRQEACIFYELALREKGNRFLRPVQASVWAM